MGGIQPAMRFGGAVIRVAGEHAVAGETILSALSCRVAFSEVVNKRNGGARLNGDHPNRH